MKKFMALFVALTFLATFSLIGCDQSQQPSKPAPEKGATGAPGRGLGHLGHLGHLEHLEHLRQPQLTNKRGISGYIFAKRIYPSIQGRLT